MSTKELGTQKLLQIVAANYYLVGQVVNDIEQTSTWGTF
jgi:hypothetical protein